MKVVLKSRTLCVWFGFVLLGWIVSATEPVAREVPYTWDFSAWPADSTNYPLGVIGWKIKGAASANFSVVPALADQLLIAPSDASKTTGGLHNYAEKLGILDSSSGGYALACAVRTTAKKNVTVEYDIMTLRNPFDGISDTRTNECTLQYRIGTTGDFTPTGMAYTNDSTQQEGGTASQNPRTLIFIFPASCDNQPIVQLRWAVRDLSGKGSRPSFAIGRIHVTGEDVPVGLLPPQNIRVTTTTATSLSLAWDVAPLATAYSIDLYATCDTSGTTFFAETFNGFAGSNDNNRANSLDAYTQTNGWSGATIYESDGCIRMGNSSTRGWIQTPPLSPPDTYSICFDARAWNGTSETTNIDIYAIQGESTNILKTIQLSKTNMQHFVVQAEATAGTRIGFCAKNNTENRFFLDNLSLISSGHAHANVTNDMRVTCTTATIHRLASGLQYQGVIRSVKDSEQSSNSTEFTAKTFCATLIMFN